MVANCFVAGGRFHQDFIRIVKPDKTDRLIDTSLPLESRWDSLAQLQHVFGNFGDVIDSHANADLITTTLRDLGKL